MRLLHHVMEDLLDLELADGLQVGAAAPRLREHFAVLVGQLAHGLGAACVDAEDVHHPSYAVAVSTSCSVRGA